MLYFYFVDKLNACFCAQALLITKSANARATSDLDSKMSTLIDILAGIENYVCDITFLAKLSQLFIRSADKLRVHIVP